MEEAVTRIQQMEQCFDTLRQAMSIDPASLRENQFLREQLQVLIRYYQGGQWLRDYEADEKGRLPPNLKRGVLSQDAVYAFLEEIKDGC